MSDEVLRTCNESELRALARDQGLGNLRLGISPDELVAIVSGQMDPSKSHYPGTQYSREKLEEFLQANWERIRSQLPGCPGTCRTFHCSEGKHAMCFLPNEGLVL